ncbi:MAG: DNA cytosine methyltransferase, partial [Rubrimonas sp.]
MNQMGAILRNPAPPWRFYEFFAGGGMVSAGLGAGWTCAFANDICPDKAAAWRANWGQDGPLTVGDVAALTTADLPGRPDLAWASSPCQDLSLAGRRAGLGGGRSGAFWPFWRLMLGLADEGRAPPIVAVENVAGLMTSNGGADLAALVRAMAAGGWRVGALVVDAALFAPQSRPRLFVLGFGCGAAPPPRALSPGPVARWHPPALATAAA